MRGATSPFSSTVRMEPFLSTLPVRGATFRWTMMSEAMKISIHAPREGSDSFSLQYFFMPPLFLSTLPVRGATI